MPYAFLLDWHLLRINYVPLNLKKNIIEIYIPDPKLISQLKLKVYIS